MGREARAKVERRIAKLAYIHQLEQERDFAVTALREAQTKGMVNIVDTAPENALVVNWQDQRKIHAMQDALAKTAALHTDIMFALMEIVALMRDIDSRALYAPVGERAAALVGLDEKLSGAAVRFRRLIEQPSVARGWNDELLPPLLNAVSGRIDGIHKAQRDRGESLLRFIRDTGAPELQDIARGVIDKHRQGRVIDLTTLRKAEYAQRLKYDTPGATWAAAAAALLEDLQTRRATLDKIDHDILAELEVLTPEARANVLRNAHRSANKVS